MDKKKKKKKKEYLITGERYIGSIEETVTFDGVIFREIMER